LRCLLLLYGLIDDFDAPFRVFFQLFLADECIHYFRDGVLTTHTECQR